MLLVFLGACSVSMISYQGKESNTPAEAPPVTDLVMDPYYEYQMPYLAAKELGDCISRTDLRTMENPFT